MGIEDVTLTYTNTPTYDYKGSKSNLETAKTQLADFITNVNSKMVMILKLIFHKNGCQSVLKTYAVKCNGRNVG